MTIHAGGSTAVNHHRNFSTPTSNQLDALNRYAQDPSIPEPVRYGITYYLSNRKFTFSSASDTIGMIKAFLAAEMEKGDPVTETGIYVDPKTEGFLLVKRSQIGRLYALDLVINDRGEKNPDGTWKVRPRFEWRYENGGAKVKRMSADWMATPEQIKQWGDIWGTCIKCHAELTRQDSIERGMGKTCYENQFGK